MNADLLAELLIRALIMGRKDVPKSTHAPLCITEDFYDLDYDVLPQKGIKGTNESN